MTLPLNKLKKKVWNIFSKYIRLKYSKDGVCKCVTCGTYKPWKEMQAGHFIPGRGNSILFEEENVHPQCKQCNIFNHGKLLEYNDFMEATYGVDKVDYLRSLSKQPRKFTREELEEMLTKYEALCLQYTTS